MCSFTFNNRHNIAISTNTFELTVVYEQHVVRSPITYLTRQRYIRKVIFFPEQFTFYLPFLCRRHTRNQNYEEIEKFGLVGETFFQRFKRPLNEKQPVQTHKIYTFYVMYKDITLKICTTYLYLKISIFCKKQSNVPAQEQLLTLLVFHHVLNDVHKL